jgi:transposase
MDEQAKKYPKDWREARRERAWDLKQKGWKQKDIAEALGVSAGAVSQWLKRAEEKGPEALRRQPRKGAVPRLSSAQMAHLRDLLTRGAEACGFQGEVWTQPRVAALIQAKFGVTYHPAHVGRLLKRLGWSRQQPVVRASQRDEAAIERWRSATWETLKKKPSGKDAP